VSRPGPSRTNRIERRAAERAAHRAVITAARRIERAVLYGLDATAAHREYDRARAALTATRQAAYALAGGHRG
jgi:hypothetical protein